MYNVIGADGKQYGPVSVDQLRAWLAQGRINAQTRIQAIGTTEWHSARDVGDLASLFPSSAGAAPGAPPPVLKAPTDKDKKKGMAVLSFVLGLCSFALCLNAFTGIPAIILGHVARKRAAKSPDRFGGTGFAVAGIVLGYVSILFALVIAALIIPEVSRAPGRRARVQRPSDCQNNLRQIGLALKVWALERNDQYPFNVRTNSGGSLELCSRGADGFENDPVPHLLVISNELSSTVFLVCPDDKGKHAAAGFEFLRPENVSYRLRTGTNINGENPQEILAVCPIHGNVLYCDGNVRKSQNSNEVVMRLCLSRVRDAARFRWFSALVRIILGLVTVDTCFASDGSKKLIEFGWDEPDTSFLRSNIQIMAQTPFDGCVFHADYHQPDGSKGSFTWQAWGTRAFSENDLAGPFADLKELRPKRLKYNFLRFNTTPAKLDWFDDYSAVLANAGVAARLARVGNCPGILFDIEQYEGPLFDYRKQRDAPSKSWELYAAQARLRGNQVMRAFEDNYPGLCVFLTFGYSLPWSETAQGKKSLAECRYGLLAPFLDGMVQAAGSNVRLVDGYELSYGYKTAAQFATARQVVAHDLLPIVQDPKRYAQVCTLSFGIWLDRDWRTRGWDPTEFSKNYFSPEEFGTCVTAALSASDDFVWIYSESPRWWGPGASPRNQVPAAYVESLSRARSN